MQKRQTFSIGYFLLALAIIMLVQTLVTPHAKQISYAEFKTAISEGKV